MRANEERTAGATPAPVINVTPLIDILLVLLIIFMVITPLRPARFKANVPSTPESEKAEMSPRTLVVAVGGDLSLKLIQGRDVIAEGSVGDSGAVAARLAQVFAEYRRQNVINPELANRLDLTPDARVLRTVFIKAPRSVVYGEVARVIDSVKGAGASPIGLQTEALNE